MLITVLGPVLKETEPSVWIIGGKLQEKESFLSFFFEGKRQEL